jgi:2'-5' RNA ligase
MPRAFIAIQLSDDLKRQIEGVQADLERQVARQGKSGRIGKIGKIGWTQPAGIHLTLKFLGEIPETQIEDVSAVVRRAASAVEPFALEARGLGAFPNPRAPRVLWLGLHGEPGAMDALQRLQAAVEKEVAVLGFPRDDRAFTPHLTLARVRDRGAAEPLEQVLAADRDRIVGSFRAGALALIKSELRPSGAVYTTLVEVPLGGGV